MKRRTGEHMDLIKRIELDLRGERIEVITLSAEGGTELQEIKDIIRREYQRRGYIPPHLDTFDDEYDKHSIYFGTYVNDALLALSLIHISEPTRLGMISYAVFCLKK